MIPELQRDAQRPAHAQDRLLIEGYGSLGYMSIAEWKERHNLADAWKLGDPYPPESDLAGKPVPIKAEEYYRCHTCKDAHWVKHYPEGPIDPKLIRCPDCE